MAIQRADDMKEAELLELGRCASCGKKLCESGLPLFYLLRIERYGIRADAMRRRDGLAMVLGSSKLAAVMGPDEDIAVPVMEAARVALCEPCGSEHVLRFVPGAE